MVCLWRFHHGFSSFSLFILIIGFTNGYIVKNHPCCLEQGENISLSMVIDAYEIYGHDPSDKLDHLAHYQIEMMKIKRAPDQYLINEHVHIATDHLQRFVTLHIKELKVLLIALDDVIDNMLTMYDNHNAIKSERVATYNNAAGGAVPSEFYLSQEYYCGKHVYIFISELYSDIYEMGKGPAPYCRGRGFHFLGFVHFMDDKAYYLEEDPTVVFQTDNYLHGLECHLGICIFRFPFRKNLQHIRDVSTLPKAIVKCGLVMYKLPPLTAASCIITSGSFILDFNIQGIRFRHHDYLLSLPNGHTYYTKEKLSPLVCDHHVCEWNNTNFYGGPFIIPGDPGTGLSPIPPYIERSTEAPPITPSYDSPEINPNITWSKDCLCQMSSKPVQRFKTMRSRMVQTIPRRRDKSQPSLQWTSRRNTVAQMVRDTLDGCWFLLPPNYGSIAGISYLDPLTVNEYRFSCQGNAGNKGLYWYPQWMGAPPHHPYPKAEEVPNSRSPLPN